MITIIGLINVWTKEHILLKSNIKRLKTLIEEPKQEYPWMATQLSDFEYMLDIETAKMLRTKKHPAIKAAEKVSEIAKEKRSLKMLCKMYEYQLNYYETIFPWLIDAKEEDPKELAQELLQFNDSNNEYDVLQKWLSPNEYSKLPDIKKYQLALDRYKAHKKTKWQAGIAYERYIGYLYEQKGFTVNYNGATEGKEDMGIDIIATKEKNVTIVQCKRYSVKREKEVHENTVFQLFGTATLYGIQHPEYEVIPAIYSTYVLSNVARQCAEALNIELNEMVSLPDYPLIKCNIAKNGEKIYHLPFDQQYDKVKISGSKGEQYVSTVADADKLGFRRAFRWRPANN